jgi:hypothetical protein
MKTKLLLAVLWIQVALAAINLSIMLYSQMVRPAIQIEYSRSGKSETNGVVSAVFPGGAADRAGIRAGDRILMINGAPVRPGAIALFYAEAGSPVRVVLDRAGKLLDVDVIPVTFERARRDSLRAEPRDVMWAIAGYLTFPLHLWMFALGVILLALRSENVDARLSSLTFLYWAGGVFLFEAAGTGSLLQHVPSVLRATLFTVDSLFIALFFAACLHFAMVFPSDPARPLRPRWLVVLPYLLSIPIFVEELLEAWTRVNPTARVVIAGQSNIYTFLGPTLLVAALVILAVRFTRTAKRNARRRQQLIFLALLPGVFGFIFVVILSRMSAGPAWVQFGRLVNQIGVFIGSSIYAYAVIRHRMYDIRVLVRRSIQYALARGTLMVLMALPAVALGIFLYAHRDQSVSTLLTGQPLVYIVLIAPLVIVSRYRKRLLDALDRRYFREQYDARHLLLQVVSMVRNGSDVFAVSRVALDEIAKALHPKHISLWQLDADGRELVRGFHRGDPPSSVAPLPATGALPTLLSSVDEPLDRYNRHNRSLVDRLPVAERDRLDASGAHLLVPMLIQQRLVGMVLLGERKSEDPYSAEDRELLRSLAAQLALTLDYSRLKGSPSLIWGATPPAAPMQIADVVRSCPSCGRCFPSEVSRCETDQTPLAPEEGVPRTIDDKYVLTRLIGRGGMGSVYLATQTRLNRPVAIKVLLAHLVGSSTMRSRFEREARIVARLRHPSIVTVHDFGTLPSGHAYLVMEYLDGQTLRKLIGTKPALDDSMRILDEVCTAVDAAHRAGVVHRDLKPENIVLVRDHDHTVPSARVLDFGLAKMSGPLGEDEATLVQSAKSIGVVGTLMYMAPEVLSGTPADSLSDQYSLGLIAYELLSGAHPYSGAGDLASIVQSHVSDEPEPLAQRAPHLPISVCQAVHRALAKDASVRFPSVAAFVDALRGGLTTQH